MQGDKEIIALLNEQLTSELTAINQYFLHAKLQENWGYTKLAALTRAESIDEMRHAEELTDRILFLEGLPNYQKLNTLHIGQTVKEQLQADLELEVEVVRRLRPGIALMRERGTSLPPRCSSGSSPTRSTTSTTWRPSSASWRVWASSSTSSGTRSRRRPPETRRPGR